MYVATESVMLTS